MYFILVRVGWDKSSNLIVYPTYTNQLSSYVGD